MAAIQRLEDGRLDLVNRDEHFYAKVTGWEIERHRQLMAQAAKDYADALDVKLDPIDRMLAGMGAEVNDEIVIESSDDWLKSSLSW